VPLSNVLEVMLSTTARWHFDVGPECCRTDPQRRLAWAEPCFHHAGATGSVNQLNVFVVPRAGIFFQDMGRKAFEHFERTVLRWPFRI